MHTYVGSLVFKFKKKSVLVFPPCVPEPEAVAQAPGAAAPQGSEVAGSARPRRAAAAGEEGARREADVFPARR